MKNTYGGVLILVKLRLHPTTLLKLTLLYGCLSRFLICTDGTKSRNASQMSNQTATLQQENRWFRRATRSSLLKVLFKKLLSSNHAANLKHDNINAEVSIKLDWNISSIFMFSCRFAALLDINICPLIFVFGYLFRWVSGNRLIQAFFPVSWRSKHLPVKAERYKY